MAIKQQLRLEDFYTSSTTVTRLEYKGPHKDHAAMERRRAKNRLSNRGRTLKESGHGPNPPRDRALNRCPGCKRQGTGCSCKEEV